MGVDDAHQLHVPIGICIRDLAAIALVGDPEDVRDKVIYLPL